MKNKLIFSLFLIAALLPQWSPLFNITATAIWLWLPEFKLHWQALVKVNEKIIETICYSLLKHHL